jgi:hypothetical protein
MRVWLPLTPVPRTRAQPVFVYIPPDGELRGGAWVVIDPTINADQVGASFSPARPPVLVLLHVSGCCHESYVSLCQMEMYTDSSARGGILEPPGIVEIKYRRDQLLHTMARLDPEIASLQMQLGTAPEKDRVLLASQLKRRQELLLPFYTRVAEHYADLHDVPVRMTNKGCIHGIVDWRHTRAFFHARLRRRLAEAAVVRLMRAADPESDVAACKAPPPPSRTKWTRLVHPSVLTGHVSSLSHRRSSRRRSARTSAPRPRPARSPVAKRMTTAAWRPPPSRTKWTRRVPHPVLIGHAASLGRWRRSSRRTTV